MQKMQKSPKGLLQRSTTFDDRRKVSKFDVSGFHSLRKAKSMVPGKAGDVEVTTVTYPDILYRRFFGREQDENVAKMVEMKLPSNIVDAVVTSPVAPSGKGVVVVDTFSTGAMLAYYLAKAGYNVVCVLSGDLLDLIDMVPEGLNFSFSATFKFNKSVDGDSALEVLVDNLLSLNYPISAVFAGAETGVELADRLSEKMGLRTNGTAQSEARRNKYIMGETVRNAGLRAVKQLKTSTWGELSEWLNAWNPSPFNVIVKPLDSAGSDDVTLCRSIEEVQVAFGNIVGKVNGLGLVNKAVLVQEYLEGQEYVVDAVSRDGVHKVVAIWAYDRRPANGASFVLFGQRLLSMNDENCAALVAYQTQVLTAVGIRNGPSHGEVKWCNGEPCLVEVGARCHGAEGLWANVASECLGYNQVGVSIDSYLDAEAFNKIPSVPSVRHKFGGMKFFVNRKAKGTFLGMDKGAMNEITSMESYRNHQIFVDEGSQVIKTENCFSWIGCVTTVHANQEHWEADYSRLLELETGVLFQIQEERVVPAHERICVAIVDPFSTGAVLAARLNQQKVDVIAVYSSTMDQLERVQSLVPKGLQLTFEAVVPFQENIDTMIEAIRQCKSRVIEVIAGAETGVELADRLSEKMGLRTNGTAQSEARRNKYIMGETVRNAGLRAVKQLKTSTWGELSEWLNAWNPSPFNVIVKPLDSAGSDDVTLCRSFEEVHIAFERINGKINGLGTVNKGILAQEYLEGQEYVIDAVSRDGVHKVVAIWAYDRRAVNGASFVCFGQRLLTIDDENCAALVAYQTQVLTAVGIRNGPSHGEVKWCKGEPCLVEVGARCHGAEGAWVESAQGVYGYNQAHVHVDCLLDETAFAQLPSVPTERHGYGRVLFFVVKTSGVLKEINEAFVDEIESMASLKGYEFFLRPGQSIVPTVDCFTFGGLVKLFHTDKDVVSANYDRLRAMEDANLFICE